MNFWESLQYASWKIQAFFGNKDAGIHADSLKTVTSATSGMDKQINDTINAYKIKHTGILGDLQTFGNNLVNAIKALPWIIVAVGAVLLFIYLYPLAKRSK